MNVISVVLAHWGKTGTKLTQIINKYIKYTKESAECFENYNNSLFNPTCISV